MATLYEMQNDLRKYYTLKEKLTYIVNNINSCRDELKLSMDNFLSAYSVDEASKGYDDLSKISVELKNRRDTINNTIIPAINSEITKLKRKIEEEQAGLT